MRCPYCGRPFQKKNLAVEHVKKAHSDRLEAENMDACQALYYHQHGKLTGSCMSCGKPTEWNFKTGKPSKLCADPKCRQRLRELYQTNMRRSYGTDNLLVDMERQRTMQHNRKITGTYTFRTDGGKVEYMGRLEQNFLMFCDTILDLTSNMIIEPPEYFPYYDEKTKQMRTYMPDYYLPDYNLLVEIKDGGDHPNGNKAFNDTTKYKVEYKDKVMREQTKYNFIRISGANYGPFMETLYKIVHDQEDDGRNRNAIVIINETACDEFEDHVDFSTDREEIDASCIKLVIGYITGTSIPKCIAITDSKFNASWYVSDFQEQTLSHLNVYEYPDLFGDMESRIYRYIGDAIKMQSAFPAIVTAAEQAEGQHEWSILAILAGSGIFVDDNIGVRNNLYKNMNFVLDIGGESDV